MLALTISNPWSGWGGISVRQPGSSLLALADGNSVQILAERRNFLTTFVFGVVSMGLRMDFQAAVRFPYMVAGTRAESGCLCIDLPWS